MRLRPKIWIGVVRGMIFSRRAARATLNLIVEQGWTPPPRASFWFTIVRMRPLVGSTTTIEPLYGPRASIAAERTVKSSPVGSSPEADSANVGSSHVWTQPRFFVLEAITGD